MCVKTIFLLTNEIQKWSQADLPDFLSDELTKLEQNSAELKDYFYQYLKFGTAGMRGKLGVGPNRMNSYTVRHAAAGLAQYVAQAGPIAKEQGVVIAYNTRHFPYEFALETD